MCLDQIKTDTNCSVESIVSDCGSEFMSKRTQEFFLQERVVHKTSALFTPSQNGFIERENGNAGDPRYSILQKLLVSDFCYGCRELFFSKRVQGLVNVNKMSYSVNLKLM